jgi:hypothetical protein
MTKAVTRYVVRNGRGEELVVPSLADLHALYSHGFLSDDDLVRQERSHRWIEVRHLPALRGVRERRSESPRKIAILIAALLIAATGIGILLSR